MFSTPHRAVVAYSHFKDEWALIVLIYRNQAGGRYIQPFLAVTQHSPTFALCPYPVRVIPTVYVDKELRDGLLDTVIADHLRNIRSEMNVLEESKAGFLKKLQAISYTAALEGFTPSYDEAFRWLCERSQEAESTLHVARYLAIKHKLHETTHSERAAAAEQQIRNQRQKGL